MFRHPTVLSCWWGCHIHCKTNVFLFTYLRYVGTGTGTSALITRCKLVRPAWIASALQGPLHCTSSHSRPRSSNPCSSSAYPSLSSLPLPTLSLVPSGTVDQPTTKLTSSRPMPPISLDFLALTETSDLTYSHVLPIQYYHTYRHTQRPLSVSLTQQYQSLVIDCWLCDL